MGLFVGIDIAKETLEIKEASTKTYSQPHTAAGIRTIVRWMTELRPTLVAMEATGGLEKALARALDEAGINVAVVNPRQVRDFARSLGRLAKTDRFDAEVLALYAERVRPEPRPLSDANTEQLDELRSFYWGLVTRGKARMVALVACMRKLVVTLNAMLKHNAPWRPDSTRSFTVAGPRAVS